MSGSGEDGAGISQEEPISGEASLREAASWLPELYLELCGTSARLLGGHNSSAQSMFVQCLCPACQGQPPTVGLKTLEAFYEHITSFHVPDDDEEIKKRCYGSVAVVPTAPGGGRPLRVDVEGCPLLKDYLKAEATTTMKGAGLVGASVYVYWYDEPRPAPPGRQKSKPKIRFGVWYEAEVVGFNKKTGEHKLKYKNDEFEALAFLPFTFAHFGARAPAPNQRPKPPDRGANNAVPAAKSPAAKSRRSNLITPEVVVLDDAEAPHGSVEAQQGSASADTEPVVQDAGEAAVESGGEVEEGRPRGRAKEDLPAREDAAEPKRRRRDSSAPEPEPEGNGAAAKQQPRQKLKLKRKAVLDAAGLPDVTVTAVPKAAATAPKAAAGPLARSSAAPAAPPPPSDQPPASAAADVGPSLLLGAPPGPSVMVPAAQLQPQPPTEPDAGAALVATRAMAMDACKLGLARTAAETLQGVLIAVRATPEQRHLAEEWLSKVHPEAFEMYR